MPQTVRINASKSYDVIIGEEILDSAGEMSLKVINGGKVAVITDDKVAKLYLTRVTESFKKAGFDVVSFIFKNGEKSKNINTFSEILEFMAENQLTRSDAVVALGGGVSGDMAGFAASVYLRGIRFIQIPTTLLAAVDSSVGGKTAIDLKAGKNLAGAFYQPELVICDYKTFDTLEPEVFSQGMAEVIKYGLIFDKELFDLIKDGSAKEKIESVIKRCVELKRDVVVADEHDKGERQLLNFGHTIGHAVEKCSDFAISHGFAVAIGMVIASRASYAKGYSNKDCTQEIINALKCYSLPIECDFSAQQLYDVALNDKKRDGAAITLVTIEELGRCVLKKTPVKEVLDFIKCGI